jgi:hypothetical protein
MHDAVSPKYLKLALASIAFAACLTFTHGEARAATTCTPPAYPSSGSFTSLKVTKANCSKAKVIATGFHSCRTKTGPSGRCVKKVSGFACQEKRTSTPANITGSVTCKRKKVVVKIAYAQTL